jgi:hypothetical protein
MQKIVRCRISQFSFFPIILLAIIYWPPLWSSDRDSWLQIQSSGFDSLRYQICWVVGLERGPLNHVSTIVEVFERPNSDSGLENRDYGRRVPPCWPRDPPPHPQNLVLSLLTSGGRPVGIVRSWTKITELFIIIIYYMWRRIYSMYGGKRTTFKNFDWNI